MESKCNGDLFRKKVNLWGTNEIGWRRGGKLLQLLRKPKQPQRWCRVGWNLAKMESKCQEAGPAPGRGTPGICWEPQERANSFALLVLMPAAWKGSLATTGEAGGDEAARLEVEKSSWKWGVTPPLHPQSSRSHLSPFWEGFGPALAQPSITSGMMASICSQGCTALSLTQCNVSDTWQLFFMLGVVNEPPRVTPTTSLFKPYYLGLSWLTGGGIINSKTRSSSGKCGYLPQWPFACDLPLSFFFVKTTVWHYFTISMK